MIPFGTSQVGTFALRQLNAAYQCMISNFGLSHFQRSVSPTTRWIFLQEPPSTLLATSPRLHLNKLLSITFSTGKWRRTLKFRKYNADPYFCIQYALYPYTTWYPGRRSIPSTTTTSPMAIPFSAPTVTVIALCLILGKYSKMEGTHVKVHAC